MALIECPECGKEISDKAVNCPSCGCPIRRSKRVPLAFIIIIATFFLLGILIGIGYWASNRNNIIENGNIKIDSSDNFTNNVNAIGEADKSVVKLVCYDYFGEEIATGSGFVAFDRDVIVTNYHVIGGAYSIDIIAANGEKFTVETVMSATIDGDIAILRANKKMGLPVLELGSSLSMQKGEDVVAIGSPLGLDNTVSEGIISGRVNQREGEVLQFTAPISSGSSGGALFDKAGKVVGITYASFVDGQNLNLAIPIENVEAIYTAENEMELSLYALLVNPEYYLYWSYDEVSSVTIDDLRKQYTKYEGKKVFFYGYVSSVTEGGVAFYLTDIEDCISGNHDFDYEYQNQCKWSECPLIGCVQTSSSDEYGCAMPNVGDLILAVGSFYYSEGGDYANLFADFYKVVE